MKGYTAVSLSTLAGREFVSGYFSRTAAEVVWPWIVERVAYEFECHPEDVDCMDDGDGGEQIAVRGNPAAKVAYRFG
jgi:hypothetical protein